MKNPEIRNFLLQTMIKHCRDVFSSDQQLPAAKLIVRNQCEQVSKSMHIYVFTMISMHSTIDEYMHYVSAAFSNTAASTCVCDIPLEF